MRIVILPLTAESLDGQGLPAIRVVSAAMPAMDNGCDPLEATVAEGGRWVLGLDLPMAGT
jgi:hypothetical protein